MTDYIRLCQLDGALPNYALLRLAQWHRERGDVCHLYRGKRALFRGQGEPTYARVYASAIFTASMPLVERFRAAWPEAVVSGSALGKEHPRLSDVLGEEPTRCDYSLWPEFVASIGYTHRGCDLKCKHCFVPGMEPGGPTTAATVADLWRGGDAPRRLHLLDNSFFAQPEWRERVAEIREGGFKVCFSQGINIRAMTPEVAASIAAIDYRDTKFDRRRLYTAWDNYGDLTAFFRGVELLGAAGVPPDHLMAYMLMGFAKGETMPALETRFWAMARVGIRPYPMIYVDQATGAPRNGLPLAELKRLQRWAILGRYHGCALVDFDESKRDRRPRRRGPDLFDGRASA